MTAPDIVFRGRRVVRAGASGPAAVHCAGGKIVAVTPPLDVPPGCPIVEAGDAAVLPGIVDSHVHVNDPGRAEWEGFETATRAAAAGGVTTIVDMPLNSSPVTTTVPALRAKARAASGRAWVDYAFWGGVVPDNERELEPLIAAGVCGFKCFLIHSGIDEFRNVAEADLERVMPLLARAGSVLLVHAELQGPIDAAARELAARGAPPRRYATFLASRPRAAEDRAVELVIRLCRETGCPVHIVHLSSADALAGVDAARREGLPVTAETCPHYLAFAAEEIPDGATWFKCCPPIREGENRERLWSALRAGTLDMVVSDHSPCPPTMKHVETGDFTKAWGGISALQHSLSLVWTEARARGVGLEDLVAWMCRAPARLAGLEGRKGDIAPGHDADLVVFDPERTFVPEPSTIHHRHKLTPAAGRALSGVVERTFVRGREVWSADRRAFPAGPIGTCLRGAP